MNARSIIPAGRRLRILKRPPEAILPVSPRPQRRDCHGRLIAALMELAGEGAILSDSTLTPWCSATFVGARHGIRLDVRGVDAALRAAALARLLPEFEFRIPGHIVADVALDDTEERDDDSVQIALSILTIEDW
jgi:hypothetical protein